MSQELARRRLPGTPRNFSSMLEVNLTIGFEHWIGEGLRTGPDTSHTRLGGQSAQADEDDI
jgi:hypothetical protein